jgi:hypothetical protein
MNNPNIWALTVVLSGAGYLISGSTATGAIVGAMAAALLILWVNKPQS